MKRAAVLGWGLWAGSSLVACGAGTKTSTDHSGNTGGSAQGGTQSETTGGSTQGGSQSSAGGSESNAAGSTAGGTTAAAGSSAGGSGGSGASASGGSSSNSDSCTIGAGIALFTDSSAAPTLNYAANGTFAQKSDGSCEGDSYIQYDWAVVSYYDGFKLDLPQSVDASGASGLSFAYRLGADDPNFFFIRVVTAGGQCAAGCDVEYHASNPDWAVVSIPMSKFTDSGEVDMSAVTALEIGFSGPDATGTLLIDNIVFTD